jgi:cysteine desulfurase
MPYFDHSATTPIHPKVLKKMMDVAQHNFGNPSSVYASGRKSNAIIQEARRTIATAIHASPSEIIFTGGGSEANNMVLWSLIQSNKKHVVTSSIEHPAILTVLEKLEPLGITFTVLPVNHQGRVNPKILEKSIQPDTGLISIMMANNEVGTIQPITELIEITHNHEIPFHSDAVQTLGKIPLSVQNIQADFISFSAHKLYGPKGVGFLYKRKGVPLSPLIIGGGQEGKHRAGTENVSGIAGMGEAARLASENLSKRMNHLEALETVFIKHLNRECHNVVINGCPKHHLPGVISASFPGYKSDILLAKLDRLGMEVSSGSACGSGSIKPSPVLEAMGISDSQNISTLRFSFGRDNTEKEVIKLVKALGQFANG